MAFVIRAAGGRRVEHSTAWVEWLVLGAGQELMLFASVGLLLIGLDDLLFDAVWLGTGGDSRGRDEPASHVKTSPVSGPLAVFIPAWDEESVIGTTLAESLKRWRDEDLIIYVGCYPNDAATLFSVSKLAAHSPQLRLVISPHDGPTTKADNLNQLWQAMIDDERNDHVRFAAVILHDAEDLVQAGEPALYRRQLVHHSMVQIPVVPALDATSRWIGGHYADEFAEAHGKEMPLRARLRLPLTSAGVGCAISRHALALLALHRDGQPFRVDSLTEDYEMGLMISQLGLSSSFVDSRDRDGSRVVSRGIFPQNVETAVRQKARWIAGIALASWDQLGWLSEGPDGAKMRGERQWLARWMLWRDRRAPLAAIVLLAAYMAICLAGMGLIGHAVLAWGARPLGAALRWLLAFNLVLLLWRLGMRSYFAARCYGWRQGAISVPRAFVSNIIAILAARRALVLYGRILLSRSVMWHKTAHPRLPFAETDLSARPMPNRMPTK